MPLEISCQNCQAKLPPSQRSLICPYCSASAVEYQFVLKENRPCTVHKNQRGIWRYEDFLPVFRKRITLGEGNTPIRKARQLFKEKVQLSFKIEGANPTGSFLDRVSPLMVSDALSQGMKTLVCASDGNLGASLSAYSAAAQLKCYCVIPKNTSPEKKTQMQAFGAEIISFGETIDDSLSLAKKMIEKGRYQATPEYNILTIEGTKTIAFEIIEELGRENTTSFDFPEYLIIPMGSGGLLYSIWRGFKQAQEAKLFPKEKRLPKIIGVQVEGYDVIVKSLATGKMSISTTGKKGRRKTIADAISVRKPTYGEKAMESIRESKGTATTVSEEEIITASKMLAQKEGLFVELSSAAVVAAATQLVEERFFTREDVVLAVITSSGLKTSHAFQRKTSPTGKIRAFRSMGTKLEILTLITQKEADFGYAIWKELGESISLQAVYQHLKELVTKGFIKEDETTERQKKYSLTEKGRKLLQKMNELEELFK